MPTHSQKLSPWTGALGWVTGNERSDAMVAGSFLHGGRKEGKRSRQGFLACARDSRGSRLHSERIEPSEVLKSRPHIRGQARSLCRMDGGFLARNWEMLKQGTVGGMLREAHYQSGASPERNAVAREDARGGVEHFRLSSGCLRKGGPQYTTPESFSSQYSLSVCLLLVATGRKQDQKRTAQRGHVVNGDRPSRVAPSSSVHYA